MEKTNTSINIISKDFDRKYLGMKCKEPDCPNIDLDITFWGLYCVPCGSFYHNHKKNNSQACKNFIKSIEGE